MMTFKIAKKILAGGMVAAAMMAVSTTTFTGCLTDDKAEDTTKPATKTPLSAAKTLAVGAQGATLGSVMDLDAATDAGMVLNSAAANAAQSTIDLVFMFYGGKFYMNNAVAAKAAGVANDINLTNTYKDADIKDIKIVKVTTKPTDQEAAKAALTAGTASSSNMIAGGEMFIIMTTGNKVALVTVGTIVGTDKAANGSFMVSINTI